jgi:cytochrome c553
VVRTVRRNRRISGLIRSGIAASLMTAAATWGGVMLASEWKLRHRHDLPLPSKPLVFTSPDVVQGERMAKIVGCWAGCHGLTGEGDVLEMEGYYRVTAPTLSAVLPAYTDEELVRLVRFGIKRDGSSLLGMTAYTFFPLSDEDLSNIIAHLRRQPAQPPVPREKHVTWWARLKLLQGQWQLAADQIDPSRPRWGALPRSTAFERGRYLAAVTCSECHGLDFRGNVFQDNTYDGGPSLSVIAAYEAEDFRQLMRTGTPVGGRELRVMGWVARNAFVYFTDQEIDDIRVFLLTYHEIPNADLRP